MSSKFEQIVQSKFEGASSSVPSNAWTGVSAGLGASGGSALFASISAKIIIGLVVVGAVTTSVILITQDDPQKTTTSKITPPLEEGENSTLPVIENSDLESEIPLKEEVSNTSVAENTHSNAEKKIVSQDEALDMGVLQNDSELTENPSNIEKPEAVIPSQDEDLKGDQNKGEAAQSTEQNSAPTQLPTAINIEQTRANSYDYRFNLNADLGPDDKVQWFVNDLASGEQRDLEYQFINPGKQTVLALVYRNGVLESTLIEDFDINAVPVLKVPNTFTPHTSLGLNDVFDIDHDESKYIEGYQIQVFSVKNELVFSSTAEKIAWDGYINGSPANEGVYIYKIIYWPKNGPSQTERGNVILQR